MMNFVSKLMSLMSVKRKKLVSGATKSKIIFKTQKVNTVKMLEKILLLWMLLRKSNYNVGKSRK